MAGLRDPIAHDSGEFLRRVSRVGDGDDLDDALLATRRDRFHVAFEDALERLLILPLRVLRRQLAGAIERKQHLEVRRLLRPERAVVVEDRDPLRHRHEVRAPFASHSGDEIANCLLRRRVVPGGQRVGS
jgi:hypothetical protein